MLTSSPGKRALRRSPAIPFLVGLLVLCGCSSFRPPRLTVSEVTLDEITSEAFTVDIVIEAHNDNSDAIPLRQIVYAVSLGDAWVFQGTRSPESTLRSNGSQFIHLPAAFAFGPGREQPPSGPISFSINGTLAYATPGALGQVLFDTGVRRPKAKFSGAGQTTLQE